jgi:hypothetical protein
MHNDTGEVVMVGLRDAGHCTLAEILQFLGDQDRSSLDSEDNLGLALRNYIGARPMAAKTEGALFVLGLLLAFGLIDRAVAQQQITPPGQGQVQIVPQTPGYQAPKPYQVTPQTTQPTPMYPQTQAVTPQTSTPTPMYPQYQVAPQTTQPTQQKGNAQ